MTDKPMPTTEAEILNAVRVEASRLGLKMFRNNVGMGWAGKLFRPPCPTSTIVRETDVVLYNARPINAGLCVGSSDLIGWRVVEITPDMVGSKLAVFTAIETKTTKGKMTAEQTNFLRVLNDSGGTGFLVRGVHDLRRNLKAGGHHKLESDKL